MTAPARRVWVFPTFIVRGAGCGVRGAFGGTIFFGNHLTAAVFTGVLKAQGVALSMAGRRRALDNIVVERRWRSVKHDDVYLKGYVDAPELRRGLVDYLVFYNTESSHQVLGYRTPDEVYQTARGGGARIIDPFSDRETSLPQAEVISGQRRSVASDKVTLLNSTQNCLD